MKLKNPPEMAGYYGGGGLHGVYSFCCKNRTNGFYNIASCLRVLNVVNPYERMCEIRIRVKPFDVDGVIPESY